MTIDTSSPTTGAETSTMSSANETDHAVIGDVTPADRPAVEVIDLCKRYGKFTAVRDLSFDVPVGSIYGLVGPNGAGKTTTFAVLATLLKPTSGAVRLMGLDPADSAREVRRVMGYMPDGLGMYANLDVDEYLRFYAAAYKLAPSGWDDLVDGLLELVALTSKRTARVDSLSRGMKQRLSLARALIHDPSVLILDEPASGLDPRARAELRDLLFHLASLGKTIVISSHILSELEDVCSHIAIIQDGSLLAAGHTDEITNQLTSARRVLARFADGTSEEFEIADEREQGELLQRLANESDRRLIEFERVGGGLEELFLAITKGIGE